MVSVSLSIASYNKIDFTQYLGDKTIPPGVFVQCEFLCLSASGFNPEFQAKRDKINNLLNTNEISFWIFSQEPTPSLSSLSFIF